MLLLMLRAAPSSTCSGVFKSSVISIGNSRFLSSTTAIQKKVKYDQVGPADPVSNLRPVKVAVQDGETELQRKLRLLREQTQVFNQKFWTDHNEEFTKKREEFIAKILKERYPGEPNKKTLTAEEMSEYYKDFLDAKWKSHLNYNLEWQKRNLTIVGLTLATKLESALKLKK